MADTLTSSPFQYPMGSFYGNLDARIKVLEAAVGSGGGAVPDFSITTFKLADSAVTYQKLAADAISRFGTATDVSDARARVTTLEAKQGIKHSTAIVNPNTAAVTFTGIPTGVKRVTAYMGPMTISASAVPIVRLGSAGAVQSTGYLTSTSGASSTSIGNASEASGITLVHSIAPSAFAGLVSLERVVPGSNIWVYRTQNIYSSAASGSQSWSSGYVVLGADLDRLQFTTMAGTALLNGTLNIAWEF